jgi:hypothetical protein
MIRFIILKHIYSEAIIDGNSLVNPARLELAIKNVSVLTVSTVLFEVIFYDIEGNVLSTQLGIKR